MSKIFPEIETHKTRSERRSYIKACLVEMARDGTLFLTECLNDLSRGPEIPQLVAEVILGHAIGQDGYQRHGLPVPQELLLYQVRISAIPYLKVYPSEKRGQLPTEKIERQPIWYKMPPDPTEDDIRTEGGWAQGSQRWKPNVINTGKMEIDLPLQHAVYCLRQGGKGVKTAKSVRLQEQYWRCEEIHPSKVKSVDEEPKRGPGRPKKQASAHV